MIEKIDNAGQAGLDPVARIPEFKDRAVRVCSCAAR